MPEALRMLIRMSLWGRLRRGMRGMRSGRGAIIGILGGITLVVWFLPAVYFIASGDAVDPQHLREIFPMVMLVFALVSLLSSGENAIYFSPGEINFLFPAPFTRRQLLTYRIATIGIASAMTSIIFTLVMGRFAPLLPAAFFGITLAFFFLSLLGMTVHLIGESIAVRMYTPGRRIAVVAILAAVAAILIPALTTEQSWEAWREARSHPLLQALLLPLEPYGHLVSAERYWPDVFIWGGTCMAMSGALFFIIVALDVNYNEASLRVSRDVYDRLQRVRAGGVFQSRAASKGISLPPFPSFAGAGVHAWRQLTHALRMSKVVLIFMAAITLVFSVVAVMMDGEGETGMSLGWASIGVGVLWITLFFANALRFDFRNDVEQMDVLKSLPIHPVSLVAGELFAPVFVTTLLQSIVAGVGAVLLGPWYIAPIVIAFAIPANTLLYGLENLSFLIYPMRAAATSPGDIQFMGRQLFIMLLKTITLGVALGFAVCIAAVALFFGLSYWLIGAMIWLIIAAEALAMIPLIILAFKRFDPSIHTPA